MTYLKDNPEQLKIIEDQLYSIILPNNKEASGKEVNDKEDNKITGKGKSLV